MILILGHCDIKVYYNHVRVISLEKKFSYENFIAKTTLKSPSYV